MDAACAGLVTQGRVLKLWIIYRCCRHFSFSHSGGDERPLLFNVNKSTLGRGEESLWVFRNIWNVNKWLWVYHLYRVRSKKACGGRRHSLSLQHVRICRSARSGQCNNTEKSREDCLPTTSVTYTTKEGFVYRIFN